MACLLALPLVACDKDKLKGPEAEVKKTDVKLDLPAVPAFDLPPAPADGSHTVKELRVRGKKLLAELLAVRQRKLGNELPDDITVVSCVRN